MFGSMDAQIMTDIWNSLNKTTEIWSRLLDEKLKKYKLTYRQYMLLRAIQTNTDGKPSITKAAKALGTTRQNVKQIIDSLEKRGFLKVEKNRKDKRNLKVSIIGLEKDFWNKIDDEYIAFVDEMLNTLKSSDLYSLAEIAAKVEKRADELMNLQSIAINN